MSFNTENNKNGPSASSPEEIIELGIDNTKRLISFLEEDLSRPENERSFSSTNYEETLRTCLQLLSDNSQADKKTSRFITNLISSTDSDTYTRGIILEERSEQIKNLNEKLIKKLEEFFSELIFNFKQQEDWHTLARVFTIIGSHKYSTVNETVNKWKNDIAQVAFDNFFSVKKQAIINFIEGASVESPEIVFFQYLEEKNTFISLDSKITDDEKKVLYESVKFFLDKEITIIKLENQKKQEKESWQILSLEIQGLRFATRDLLRSTALKKGDLSPSSSKSEGDIKNDLVLIVQSFSQLMTKVESCEKQLKENIDVDKNDQGFLNLEKEIELSKRLSEKISAEIISRLSDINSDERTRRSLRLLSFIVDNQNNLKVKNNIQYIKKASLFLGEETDQTGLIGVFKKVVSEYVSSPELTRFLNQLLSRILEIQREYDKKVGESGIPENVKDYFTRDLTESYQDRGFLGLSTKSSFVEKKEAEIAFMSQHYEEAARHLDLIGNYQDSKEVRKALSLFLEGQDAFYGLAAWEIYHERNVDKSALAVYVLDMLSGGKEDTKEFGKQGLSNGNAMAANIKFNAAGLFNINRNFNTEDQSCVGMGKLQTVIARMVEIIRGLKIAGKPEYDDKFTAGSGDFYNEDVINELIDRIFREPQIQTMFKFDSPEAIKLYKEMVRFKASRDNLSKKYANEALGRDIAALKNDRGGEPRPSGLLMSMIYQITRGKEEGHLACTEFVDLRAIINQLSAFNNERSSDNKKNSVSTGFKRIESAIELNEKYLDAAHIQEQSLHRDKYVPKKWDKDFPGMDWFANQVSSLALKKDPVTGETVRDENGREIWEIQEVYKKADDYYKAEKALMTIIETAIKGVSPDSVRADNLSVLIASLNSQFSILMSISGTHSFDQKFDFINQFALAAYKTHIKNILINVPGSRIADGAGHLTDDGEDYERNYNLIYNGVLKAFGDHDSGLKDTYRSEIEKWLYLRKDFFMKPKIKSSAIKRSFDPESMTPEVYSYRNFKKWLFEYRPEKTPWAKTDQTPNKKFMGLYKVVEERAGLFNSDLIRSEVKFADKDPISGKTRILPGQTLPNNFNDWLTEPPDPVINLSQEKGVWASSLQKNST